MKLGQMLSTRTDLLPTEFLEELAQLQQGVPPAAWPEVRALIEDELNSPIDAVFADFAEVPIASASIGQVHVARLHDGREVAVKVQRPGILPLIERDTDIAMRIAAKLEQTASWARDLGITELARGFIATLDDELDYRVEVRNMKAMAITQARHPEALRLGVPACIESASTGKLLTMQLVHGSTLSDAAALAELPEAKRSQLATRLLESMLTQIIDDGVFHSDLHPGNIIVADTGELVLLDYGAVGRLDT